MTRLLEQRMGVVTTLVVAGLVFLPLDARGVKKVTVVFDRNGAREDFSMDDVTYILE